MGVVALNRKGSACEAGIYFSWRDTDKISSGTLCYADAKRLDFGGATLYTANAQAVRKLVREPACIAM